MRKHMYIMCVTLGHINVSMYCTRSMACKVHVLKYRTTSQIFEGGWPYICRRAGIVQTLNITLHNRTSTTWTACARTILYTALRLDYHDSVCSAYMHYLPVLPEPPLSARSMSAFVSGYFGLWAGSVLSS